MYRFQTSCRTDFGIVVGGCFVIDSLFICLLFSPSRLTHQIVDVVYGTFQLQNQNYKTSSLATFWEKREVRNGTFAKYRNRTDDVLQTFGERDQWGPEQVSVWQ